MPRKGPEEMAVRAGRLVQEFTALDDPIDRYRYLIALGEGLPPLAAEERTEANRLPGCQYAVWLVCDYDPAAGLLRLRADSDAKITRGMAAVIIRVLDARPPAEVAGAELGFLDAMGLRTHLSAQRGGGLDAMVAEIRRRAREFARPLPEPT